MTLVFLLDIFSPLSNAVCRLSLRCVVFDISGGGIAAPPPRRNKGGSDPRVGARVKGFVIKMLAKLIFGIIQNFCEKCRINK